MTGVKPGDRTRQYLSDGTLGTPIGALPAREAKDLRFLAGRPGPHAVLLGVVNDEQFASLAGRQVSFEGRFTLEVARTDIVGTLPIAAGAVLDLGDFRLRIRDVQPSVPVRANFLAVATADVTWTTTWTQGWRLPANQWWFRQGAERRHINRATNGWLTWLVLLPSLAHPFGWQQAVLTVPAGDGTAIDTRTATLEIEQSQGIVETQRLVRVDFVVPATAAPFQASSAAR